MVRGMSANDGGMWSKAQSANDAVLLQCGLERYDAFGANEESALKRLVTTADEVITAKDAVIKALAEALDVTRPPERPAGCWCHHARDVKQAGHSAVCVAACDAISKAAIRSGR